MAKKLKLVFTIPFLLVGLITFANINDDIQRKQAQERRELELEKTLKEQSILKSKQQTTSPNITKDTINDSDRCILIKQINTSEQLLVDESVIDNLKSNYQDRCLSVKQINHFITALQNLYRDNGFITTKVGLSIPQTRLKEGILDVSIQVGFC